VIPKRNVETKLLLYLEIRKVVPSQREGGHAPLFVFRRSLKEAVNVFGRLEITATFLMKFRGDLPELIRNL